MMPNPKTPPESNITIQRATSQAPLPSDQQFRRWAGAALHDHSNVELLIRLVDREESQQLNARYRQIDKATNVLAFPADLPSEVGLALLGDIIICAPVVVAEAQGRHKPVEAHWAHLTVHGILHLLGHDHQTAETAFEMEALETEILQSLGFPLPYCS